MRVSKSCDLFSVLCPCTDNPSPISYLLLPGSSPCPCEALHQLGKEEKLQRKVSGHVGHTALRAVIAWEEGCLSAHYHAQGHQ